MKDTLLSLTNAINRILDRMLGRRRGVPMIVATLGAVVILAMQPVSWLVRVLLVAWLVYFSLIVAYLIFYHAFRLPKSQAPAPNPSKD
jgi:hypothetical protein